MFSSSCLIFFEGFVCLLLFRDLEMAEAGKLLYIVVVDEDEMRGDDCERKGGSFSYTRPVLQSTLQLMGCKPRHSFKV